MLPVIAAAIDGGRESAREQYEILPEARPKPSVLDRRDDRSYHARLP
jgi:hypothetical protein